MRITSARGFIAVLLSCLVVSVVIAFLTRGFPEIMLIPAILGIVALVVLLAHLILNISSRWRPHFWPISMLLALVLVSTTVYVTSNAFFWHRDERRAKQYFNSIKPSLEKFHRVHGHFPGSLKELAGIPTPPGGFRYARRDQDDAFEIEYYADIYSSQSDQWFDDD